MSRGHTPGPWKLTSGLRVMSPPHGRSHPGIGQRRDLIASVNGGRVADGDGDANAVLIAEAPRLLAALKKLWWEAATRFDGIETTADEDAAVTEAYDAIAAATGTDPRG